MPSPDEHLRISVADARAALALVPAVGPRARVQEAALLTKIVADDIEDGPPTGSTRREHPSQEQQAPTKPTDPGQEAPIDAGPRLRRGLAKHRILSVVDPEPGWKHKNETQRWAGYKVHLAEEQGSELIATVEVRPASEYDTDALLSLLDRQEQRVGPHSEMVLTDGAYGTAEVRAGLETRQIELVAKLRPITDTNHLGKDEFTIDLGANDGHASVICSRKETTSDYCMARDARNRSVRLFRFPLDTCIVCSLRERCLGGGRGRIEQGIRDTR